MWTKSSLGKQGAKAYLMKDALTGEGFSEHANHKTKHGGATIKEFNPLELLSMDLAGSSGLIPLAIGLKIRTGHRERSELKPL
jgi:hypothetical protein